MNFERIPYDVILALLWELSREIDDKEFLAGNNKRSAFWQTVEAIPKHPIWNGPWEVKKLNSKLYILRRPVYGAETEYYFVLDLSVEDPCFEVLSS